MYFNTSGIATVRYQGRGGWDKRAQCESVGWATTSEGGAYSLVGLLLGWMLVTGMAQHLLWNRQLRNIRNAVDFYHTEPKQGDSYSRFFPK
ncbi:hypothetical protein PISMIDRAFT_690754 [Pisolithus microcarpus 441]|uniref:Uncharacterized protein n=1 Tax=Pisolithus microcarpus 441 TaxID=765257 RepID=A0A0C9YK53_9AGAM|nr:hypothetical protein BKA83DRAFT_690754 [Pisolithus microcarpus]KIK10752.1 hypothetical protein PISMIDRAFT_690754 [Pisolithus microcarpus 441]